MDPRAAMTVVNDIGCVEDIHPNEKWLVARRLLLHALKRNYGFEGVEDSSPLALSATADGSRVKVVFSNAKSLYVYARGKAFSKSLAPFEIAGPDGVFKPAQISNFSSEKGFGRGLIDSSEIVLSAPGVKEPVAVRYAWQKPWTGCVYNEADLPMGTFLIEVGK
jgi:sialate O-acetylesterase